MALKPEQLIAIGYLSQPNNGGKTHEEIAKECGVTDRTIRNWIFTMAEMLTEKLEVDSKVKTDVPNVDELKRMISEMGEG
jgi:predicted transcriptional regulator